LFEKLNNSLGGELEKFQKQQAKYAEEANGKVFDVLNTRQRQLFRRYFSDH